MLHDNRSSAVKVTEDASALSSCIVGNLLCYITSAIGGDAVRRITKPQVKFSVANVGQRGSAEMCAQAGRVGEGWGRQQLCSGLTTAEDVCAAA